MSTEQFQPFVTVEATGLYIDGEYLEDAPEVMEPERKKLENSIVLETPPGQSPVE